jgi:hypothetical protein
LKLHVFAPTNSGSKPHPAMVFFFGGGWVRGTPIQFYPECAHFAAKGHVAISADCRIASVNRTTPEPFESRMEEGGGRCDLRLFPGGGIRLTTIVKGPRTCVPRH